jgi:hypothetical protein
MEPIPRSGYFYANKLALIMIKALEDVMGKNGLNAILNLAHLPQLIDNYPAGNLAKEFDFADVSAINQALEEMYGPRGGRGLALRAGRATFADALKNFGALAVAGDLAFKVLPLQVKLRIGLPAMARILHKSATSTARCRRRMGNSDTRSIVARSARAAPTWTGRSATLPLGCSRKV